MSDATERLLGLIDKAIQKGADNGRSSVAGAPFNLMAVDDVARVMDAKGEALAGKVADALGLVAAGTVDANTRLSDALAEIADAMGEMDAVDLQPAVNELQRLAQALGLAGDKSRNGQKEIADAIRAALAGMAQMQAAAAANADRVVAATEKNTKALEKVAALLGANKSVEYDDAGRPAMIRVAK